MKNHKHNTEIDTGRDSARVVAQPSPDYLRGIEDAAGMCDDEVGRAQHFIDKARGQPEAYVERLRLIKECAEGLASSIRGFKDPSVHDTPSEVLNPIRADRDAHEGQAIESDYSAGHAPGVACPTGWKLVPIEATREMCLKVYGKLDKDDEEDEIVAHHRGNWEEYLAAAPAYASPVGRP